MGALLHAGERDLRDRDVFGRIWVVERTAEIGLRVRNRAQAPGEGESAGGKSDSRSTAERAVHPKRVFGVFSRGGPERARARRGAESQAVPVVGPFLWARRSRGDVRIPDGQRHDAGRVSLVPAAGGATAAVLRDGNR